MSHCANASALCCRCLTIARLLSSLSLSLVYSHTRAITHILSHTHTFIYRTRAGSLLLLPLLSLSLSLSLSPSSLSLSLSLSSSLSLSLPLSLSLVDMAAQVQAWQVWRIRTYAILLCVHPCGARQYVCVCDARMLCPNFPQTRWIYMLMLAIIRWRELWKRLDGGGSGVVGSCRCSLCYKHGIHCRVYKIQCVSCGIESGKSSVEE